jgi:putative PIN family toxin of toxin-antitoxin system
VKFVIDTNIVVAGLLTGRSNSPVARVLDAMLSARFRYVLSSALLAEYLEVLSRPALRRLHGLTRAEIDTVVTTLAEHAMLVAPGSGPPAPDPGDQHVWNLLAADAALVLVTGDKRLLNAPSHRARVITAQDLAARWGSEATGQP